MKQRPPPHYVTLWAQVITFVYGDIISLVVPGWRHCAVFGLSKLCFRRPTERRHVDYSQSLRIRLYRRLKSNNCSNSCIALIIKRRSCYLLIYVCMYVGKKTYPGCPAHSDFASFAEVNGGDPLYEVRNTYPPSS